MSFPGVPRNLTDALAWCAKLTDVVNGILQGRTNNVGTVTLTANAATSTVTLAKGRLSTVSVIHLEPLTANAAAEIGAGTIYITAANHDVTNTKFVITHANNAQTDRDYRFSIVG